MKRVVIIGGSSGIGRELVNCFVQQGHLVGVTARRQELLSTLKASHPQSINIRTLDSTDSHVLKKLEEFIAELGGMDLLIYSSGTGDLNSNLNPQIIDKTNRLNVTAFAKICAWVFRFFERQGSGHLVNISSIAGLRGGRAAPSYNASKAYQINFLEGLRQKSHHTKSAIHITDARPGFVDTAMAKGEGQFWVAPPKKAAQQIHSAITKRKAVVYVTKRWAIIASILKILPSWLYKRL